MIDRNCHTHEAQANCPGIVSSTIRDGQDLELCLTGITIDGKPINLTSAKFEVRVWTKEKGNDVKVKVENGESDNCGDIPAKVTVEEDSVKIYAKSSSDPFGPGTVRCAMVFHLPNEKFPGGEQVVKTLDMYSNIIIV